MSHATNAIAPVKGNPAPSADAAAEAGRLISRYPNLSEPELARLIILYKELSALDMALMISDKQLGPKLDRFHADHRSQLRTPFRQYAAFVGIGVLGMLVVGWALAF